MNTQTTTTGGNAWESQRKYRFDNRRARALLAAFILFQACPYIVYAADIEAIYWHQGRSLELTNVPTDQSFAVIVTASLAEAAANFVPPPAFSPTIAPLAGRIRHYQVLIKDVAQKMNLDPRLLHALIAVESGYNPEAVSRTGAVGLMQLMPSTAHRYGIQNSHDPLQNITGGARYLRDLLNMFDNDLPLVLAAYNAGENAVLRHGRQIPPFKETVAYVPKVLALYKKLASFVL